MENSLRLYRLLIIIALLIVLATAINMVESGTGDWAPITLFSIVMMGSGVVLCVYAVRTAPESETP